MSGRRAPVDWSRVRRVHIVGGPGTGKSTLARHVGGALALSTYALDEIAYQGPDFEPRALADRLADVRRIAEEDAWVCEGIFVGWTELLSERADVVVWLDHVSRSAAVRNIVRRFVSLALREVRARRGIARIGRFRDYARHLRQLAQVLTASRAFWASETQPAYPSSREAIASFVRPFAEKTIHCRTGEDVRRLYADVAAAGEALRSARARDDAARSADRSESHGHG